MQPQHTSPENSLLFLKGGGEMGAFTRAYDWSLTSLGPPQQWPQSLRTTLGIVLNSRFPMFLFWGPELICFYNDAYRPSLGNNGKHPWALGKRGADVWPEIWADIKPLIDEVLAGGEASWSEDQLLPIYRNGKMEDVYWTFSYSPVQDETGHAAGVFVTCTETTQTVKTLQKLRISDQRFQNLVRQATVGIVVLNGDAMRVDVVNEMYGRLLNRTPEELLGKPLFSIIPETEAAFRPLLDQVKQSGEPLYLTNRPYFIYTNGIKKEGFLNLVYQPYKESDGTITGVMALCHDVTEQVLSQKQVEDQKTYLQNALDIAELGTFKIEVASKDAHFTENIKDWFGLDTVTAPLDAVLEKIIPEDRKRVRQHILASRESEAAGRHDLTYRVLAATDGTIRHLRSIGKALYTEGRLRAITGIIQDVTPQRTAQRKLEESERNFRNLVMQAPVGICIVKGNPPVVELVNDSFLEVVGKTRAAMEHKQYWHAIPEAEAIYAPILNHIIKTGITYVGKEHEIMFIRNGKQETVYLDFVYEPVKEDDGTVKNVMIVAIEITQQVLARRKIEDIVAARTTELAEANKHLQQKNKELEQFAYIASHDLQEPLRKVSTFGQLLEQSLGPVDERSQTYLDKIRASAARMVTLVRDVLQFSQLSKERETIELVDLTGIIENVKGDFELLIEQKEAQVRYDTLPVVQAIPLQMYQLFSNLLSNALKFTRAGVKPVLTIAATQVSGTALQQYPTLNPARAYHSITFCDNGIGFSQEHAEQIFGIFQRLHGRYEYAGTGIGLALCKKIAHNHQGDIFATGHKETGAVFQILLPV